MSATVSVVIPVYNSARYLRVCLEHWTRSSVRPLEILVADDGSTDDSAAVAREFGLRVVSVIERSGPSRARNLAAQQALGDILFFVDADVAVHPDTLHLVIRDFDADPELDALIGSYDDSPADPDFVSQYKNLMHCFVHQKGRHEASTFWGGCGAIRRSVFLEHSGFSESYGRPAVEDIELGYRLKAAGRKLLLDPDIQVKHLKRWTFWGLIRSDILDRGIPWTELILRERSMPNDLNLELSQRVSVALAIFVFGLAAASATYWKGLFLAPFFVVLFLLLSRYWLDESSTRSPWVRVVAAAIVAVIIWLSWTHHLKGLIPLVLFGVLLMFLEHRYSIDDRKSQLVVLSQACIALVTLVTIAIYVPTHPVMLVIALAVLILVVLNNQFYLFLARKRGRLFALAAIPFNLLYHLYNGLSFVVGSVRWAFLSRFSK